VKGPGRATASLVSPAPTGLGIPLGQISPQRVQIAPSASERDVTVGAYENLGDLSDPKQRERSTIVDESPWECLAYETMELDQPDVSLQE